MATLMRLRCTWGGTGITGPGLSTFYQTTAGSVGWADDVLTFFNVASVFYPSGLTLTVPSSGDEIDSATGALTGTWSEPGTGGTDTATGSGPWAAGVGMQVRWRTSGIVGGRRVVGSTFIVPIMAAFYDSAGTISNTDLATVQGRADALIAAHPNLVIWSRPTPTRAGTFNEIESATVPDRVSWLRSRRT